MKRYRALTRWVCRECGALELRVGDGAACEHDFETQYAETPCYVVPAADCEGAVEALRRIERGEPLRRYAWCRAVAREALAKLDPPSSGGQ
jgi:hypothetical protein